MGLPEILHRCNSCGAAIREPAMFCPECGKPLENAMSETSEQSEPQTAVAAQALGDNLAADASSPVPNHADAKVAEPATTNNVSKTTTAADQAARHGAREKTRETFQRASHAARGAIEDNVKRVERIHHVSTVMLEEASYDPSLRFVLVALGLFVIFVILLVLSKVMG